MKILCTGDFHLGAGADYGARPGDRLRDQQAVLERIAEIAGEEGVAAVLFAGDAFERRYPTPTELMVWRGFRDTVLQNLQIPLLAIAGNHDVAATELPTGMQVVGSCGRMPEITSLGEVTVATLPWTPPAHLVASQNGGDRDAIHERAAELLLESAHGLREQIDGPAILLAHWSVSGASLPNGLPVDQLREPVLPLPDLLGLGFDFIVLGHIHETQVLASNVVADFRSSNGTEALGTGSVAFYVGSPMVLNFGEAQGHHGVMLLDTEVRWIRHVEIPNRPFVTVNVDLTAEIPVHPPQGQPVESSPDGRAFSIEAMVAADAPQPRPTARHEDLGLDETDVIAAAFAEHLPLTDAVVRLRYKATAEQARRIDTAALRGFIADAGAHKLYAIQAEIVRSDRVRVEGLEEGLDIGDAIDLYAAASDIDDATLHELHRRTTGYLEQVRA